MIPLQQAQELQAAISEYLKATFTFREREMHQAFHSFINDKKEGMFRGPYVSLQLPFKKAPEDEPVPLEIKPGFDPFLHQAKAFQRLSTENGDPEPTLLTTGTGSGKTESFLYPALDYCHKNRDKKGIKAIILYPMNALATDQAQRLAEIIWKDERLKGNITAGLFIGEGNTGKEYATDMGPDHIIEKRESIIETKPDIVLTNFKMLDYGLMRNRYHTLWTHNLADSGLLKFLVLDELHTYDGAQGTDVANLIRRLKLKLKINRGELCPVGTSATIGEGEESIGLLTEYAGKVFGESFDPKAVITEERLPWHDFVPDEGDLENFIPRIQGLIQSRLSENDHYSQYIEKQKRLWQLRPDITPYQTGAELKKLVIFKDLLEVASEGVLQKDILLSRLADKNEKLRELPEWDSEGSFRPREAVLESLLAMIAYAKSDEKGDWPFLLLRVQLWVRELSGIMRFVDDSTEFSWRDSNKPDEKNRATLPMYYCRDCGASGWLAKKPDNHNKFDSDYREIFRDYFSNHKNIYLVNKDNEVHEPITEYKATDTLKIKVSKDSLELRNEESEDHLSVIALRRLDKNSRAEHVCPECGTQNSISIIGTRTATLSSISISQSLSSNLEAKDDGHRKLLAFTNSVQDAAHHAGFIEARNFRFMFRTSLQQVLNQVDRDVSLPELAEEFKSYWKNKPDDEITYYYRFYPEDCAKKAPLESYLNENGDAFPDYFKKEFDLRMDWEILAEYGYNTLIGRTLEKTGSSVVWVPNEKMEGIHQTLKPWMEDNKMESVGEEELNGFVSGLLHRLRVRGGIDHPYFNKFRQDEAKVWSLNWSHDKRHFLNRTYHQSKSRFPRLLTTAPHKPGILETTYTAYQNWYHTYLTKSFPLVRATQAVYNEFYEKLFELLADHGIVNKSYDGKEFTYAIPPSVLMVSNDARLRECNECGNTITTSVLDRYIQNSRCQQYRCTGMYSKVVEQTYDYYNKVFNRIFSPRVISREHTGILDRAEREKIEKEFKENLADRSVNTLVATSTLEMGIDIGQLDNSMNMGLPPLPSNYMQRIGRAGRKSGSSLITNFVSQKNPHDLFFFEKPSNMMEGDIHTPGCFLNAPEILRRQFLAHCIDRWTTADPEKHVIPTLIMHLKLMTTDLRDTGFFINRILTFVTGSLNQILNDVKAVYRPELEDEQLNRLQSGIETGEFRDWLFLPFYSLQTRLRQIQEQRKSIDTYIKEKNLAKGDDEYIELIEHKKALYRVRRKQEKLQVLEFMTMFGLLPNYAFPDKGVELSVRIFQPPPKGSDKEPTISTKEYVRPSSQAIRELAPHNLFFAEGHKFKIQGLLTHEWGGQNSPLEMYRFCSNCDQIAQAREGQPKNCPKCNDPSYGAASNVHAFAEMSGVKSEVNRGQAALDDSSDERDTVIYNISKHVTFESASGGSLALVNIPFGIEYAVNVGLTDVNLGLLDTTNATKVDINQNESIPRHGFVTCKHCGYSTNTPALEAHENNKNKYKFHFPYCKFKSKEYKGDSDEVFEEVYLLRKQKTEALKILLPRQNVATEEYKQIFKAGLELGLRGFFRGNPAHLDFMDYREFNTTTSRFDQYLLLYDRVPGGTGYISKLFNKDNFTEIIRKAYLTIKSCSCQHEEKDGCYHCVYSYRNQYISSILSRSRAEKIFGDLLKHASNWKPLEHSLSDITNNGKIEDSELEELFIIALEKWCEKSNYTFKRTIVNNVQTYHLIVPLARGGSITYWIKPQVWLGPSDGVGVSTKPDFLFKGVASGDGSEAYQEYHDIAIYLDGYQYHASNENNRFRDDIRRRKAILASGRHQVWTFTWEDVNQFINVLEEREEFFQDELTPHKSIYNNTSNILAGMPIWGYHEKTKSRFDNSLDRFLGLLTEKEEIRSKSISVAGLRCMQKFPRPNISKENIDGYLRGDQELKEDQTVPKSEVKNSFLKSDWSYDCKLFHSIILVHLSGAELKASIRLKEDASENIDLREWTRFWRLWNVLQYGDTEVITGKQEVKEEKPEEDDKDELLLLFDEDLHPIILSLLEHGVEFNREGSFLLPVDQDAVEAQLGFEKQKIVFKPIDDHAKAEFEKQGYEIADPATFDINRYLS